MKQPKVIAPGVTGDELMGDKQHEPAVRYWSKPKRAGKKPERIKYKLF